MTGTLLHHLGHHPPDGCRRLGGKGGLRRGRLLLGEVALLIRVAQQHRGTDHLPVVDHRRHHLRDVDGGSQQRALAKGKIRHRRGGKQFLLRGQHRPGGLDPICQNQRPIEAQQGGHTVKGAAAGGLHELDEIGIAGSGKALRHIEGAVAQPVVAMEGVVPDNHLPGTGVAGIG